MSRTTGLLVSSVKCARPAESAEWAQWYDDVHLPDLVEADGPWVATRFAVTPAPMPGMPGIGVTHVTIYEFAGDDVPAQVERLVARDAHLRARGRVHPAHAVLDAEVLLAHGRWHDKPEPGAALRGHILSHVMSCDPTREAEWDEWYDDEHVPDMLSSDAFTAATRWAHWPRRHYGPQHVTLYDVALPTVAEAVGRSAAVMPGLIAAGRKHECHTGGPTLTLEATGRRAGAGYRAGD